MNSLVSVVIPVYNTQDYVLACLESVRKQSYPFLEVIIVNDGSLDNSAFVCEEYLKQHKDFNAIVVNKKNGGLSSARNYGIRLAKGKYICFVDSDDELKPNYLSVLVKAIENDEVDAAFADFEYIKFGHKPKIKIEDNKEHITLTREQSLNAFLVRKIKLHPCLVLLKRDFLFSKGIFFDETIKYSEDSNFFWNLLDSVSSVRFCKEKIYNYFQRTNSITTSPLIEKVVSGYVAIQKNVDTLTLTPLCKKYTVHRWTFGALHNISHFVKYPSYKEFYNALDGDVHFKSLKGFADFRVFLLCFLNRVSKRLFFIVSRFV